jgi:hypothetical protein
MALTTIATGLSGLKAAAEMTKMLRDGLRAGQIRVEDVAPKIGEIYDYIIDSKVALYDAQEEVNTLRTQLEALSEYQQIDSELKHDGYVFWRVLEEETTGPFCPYCWRKDEKLIPLTHTPGTYSFGDDTPSQRYECFFHKMFLVPAGVGTRGRHR